MAHFGPVGCEAGLYGSKFVRAETLGLSKLKIRAKKDTSLSFESEILND